MGVEAKVKTACVIGGSGFLGSYVSDVLADEGYTVRVFDRVASPWRRGNQEMHVGDILDADHVERVTKDCSAVYNFAGISDLDATSDNPEATVRLNILGNVYALEACRRNQVTRYVYASTVYVQSREGGFYRCSKLAAEKYIEEYQRMHGLDFTVLRYGSLYGPRSNQENGLWRIVKLALETGRIEYEGSAEAMREYIHVRDAALASVVALGDEFRNQHLVLTGQEPMRVIDMLKMLAEILNNPGPVKFMGDKDSGHYVRTPYSYQPELGRKFIPPVHIDLGQGLLELIQELSEDKGG